MPVPLPGTERGVMGMEERAREPSVGGRMEEGVEEASVLLGVEERRERNCELFIVVLGREFWCTRRRVEELRPRALL